MKFSEAIDKIAPALVKFRSEVKPPKKNQINPHFNKPYADLQAVLDVVTPALADNDMVPLQDIVYNDNGDIGIYTMFMHDSGQYVTFDPVFVPTARKDAQGQGSALSYAKRYSLSLAACVASEDDDDANAAQPPRQNKFESRNKQSKQTSKPKSESVQPVAKPVAKMTTETLTKIKNVWESKSLAPELINKQTDKYFKLPLYELSEEQGKQLLEIFAAKKSEGVEQKKNRYAGLFAAGKEQKLTQDQVKEKIYEKYSIESLTDLDDIKLAEATKWIKTYGQTKKIS